MNRRRWVVAFAALCFVPAAAGQSAPASKPEPEEPDFAFVSGSGYTQVKKSVQFIHQTAFGSRRFDEPLGKRNEDAFVFLQRVEYGITDRWELDFVLPAAGSRTRLNGATVSQDIALADGLVGIRYRLLEEGKFPVTLTLGPQIIFPTGSVGVGTGFGSPGLAWDLAVSKDWGGPVFLYNTFNYRVLPFADDTTAGSIRKFSLHGATWASALAFRPLELPRQDGSKHDLHAFLELGSNWQQRLTSGTTVGSRGAELSWVFSPGIRYGFITSKKTLVEIGVAAPIGLGPNGPKRGIFIQFQYEYLFGEH